MFLVPGSYQFVWRFFFKLFATSMCTFRNSQLSIPTEHPPKTPIRKRHVFLETTEAALLPSKLARLTKRRSVNRWAEKKGAFCCCEMGHGKSFASAKRRSFPISARMRRTNPKRVFFCKTSWNFLRRWRNFARLRKIIRQFKKQKQGTWHTKNRDMTCLVTFGHVRLDDRIIAYARIKRLGRQLNTQSEQPSKHYWFSATSSSWHLRQVLARMRSLCNGATSILP